MTTPNTPANGGQILTDELLSKAARALADSHAKVCNVNADDNWKLYGNDFINDVRIAFGAIEADLRASLAAPAIPTVDRNAAIMRQALIDMQNPIIAMQREVPEGSVLNPHIAMQMASEPEWYKRHAQEALDKCATPATVKTAEG